MPKPGKLRTPFASLMTREGGSCGQQHEKVVWAGQGPVTQR